MEIFDTGHSALRPKKKGRRKRSNKEVSSEIQKRLSEAALLCADNNVTEALTILSDVFKEAPTFDKPYYQLSLVCDKLGRTDLATQALKTAAIIKGPKSHCWMLLYERFKGQGDLVSARKCASKAVQADPQNVPLKYEYADLCLNAGKYKDAAETYEQIFRRLIL